RGAANSLEILEPNGEPAFHFIKVRDFRKRAALPRFRALAVAGMQQPDAALAVAVHRFGGADAGVHAAAQQNDSLYVTHKVFPFCLSRQRPASEGRPYTDWPPLQTTRRAWRGPRQSCATAVPAGRAGRLRAAIPPGCAAPARSTFR